MTGVRGVIGLNWTLIPEFASCTDDPASMSTLLVDNGTHVGSFCVVDDADTCTLTPSDTVGDELATDVVC